MTEEMFAALQRLTRGKYKLEKGEFAELLSAISAAENDDILVRLFPEKPKPKPRSVKPQWLKDVESSKKQIRWSAQEAALKLYDVVESEGLTVSGQRKTSFAASARHVAGEIGEQRTRDIFCNWVEGYVENNTMR